MLKLILALMCILLTSCDQEKAHDDHKGHNHAEHEGHDHDSHEGHDHGDDHAMDGPNGGELLKVGKGIAEIEVIHNEETGKVDVYVYKSGGQEKLFLENEPRLNLTLDSGRKQLKTTAVGDSGKSHAFSITDDLLKGHVEITVSLKIENSNYSVLVHHHH